jgi:hypothetical protein
MHRCLASGLVVPEDWYPLTPLCMLQFHDYQNYAQKYLYQQDNRHIACRRGVILLTWLRTGARISACPGCRAMRYALRTVRGRVTRRRRGPGLEKAAFLRHCNWPLYPRHSLVSPSLAR